MNTALIGRPRELTFWRRLDVVLTWDERYHARVQREIAERTEQLRALAKKLVHRRASGASIIEIARLSAQMDWLGRRYEARLYKPDTHKPIIDRRVAKLFGISPRMVRTIRDDRSLDPFRSTPPWEVPDWEIAARQDFLARQLARALMTPERLAKGEPVRIFNGGLQVADTSIRPIWNRMSLKTGDWGQPDWFASQSWLEQMREASGKKAGMFERERMKKHPEVEFGSIDAPAPTVTSTKFCGGCNLLLGLNKNPFLSKGAEKTRTMLRLR
jgi:hypothetical protein